MAQKLYDLAVKTGEYTNQQGEQKSRYENIGAVMQGDNGQFVMLKRTFNPAGVPDLNGRNSDSILVSCFEPNNQQGGQQGQQQPQGNGGYNQQPQQSPQQQSNQSQQQPQGQQQNQQFNSNAPQNGVPF